VNMYVILWRFRPVVGRESEFERAYGPCGEWVRLFRREEGYLGTELLRRSDDESGECLTSGRLRSFPSPPGWGVSATRRSVGRAHRRGDFSGCLRGTPLERSPTRPLGRRLVLLLLIHPTS